MKSRESARAFRSARVGVITADLVRSRRITSRRALQRRLDLLIRSLNSHFKRVLPAPFMITLGDEIQGMTSDITQIPSLILKIHRTFHPSEISIGIGIGRIATRFSRRVTEMDGPAFVRSRDAIELAKKRGSEIAVRTDDENLDLVLNGIYSLIGGIQAQWTRPQWQRVGLYRELGTIEEVAKALGVAKQSVSKSLRNTLWLRVLEAEKNLPIIFADAIRRRGRSQS